MNLILLSRKKIISIGFFPHDPPRYPHRNSTAAASTVVAAVTEEEEEEEASVRLIVVFYLAYWSSLLLLSSCVYVCACFPSFRQRFAMKKST